MPLLSTITCAVLLVGLLAAAPAAAERTITDSAGRQVAVPDRIERVFAAGPPASVLLYVLAPERMIGWPRAPRPEELPYIAPHYRDLPEVGWLTGRGDTVNLEVLLQAKPDLIFDFGSVRATYVSLAERVQAQTGIPYILIDGTLREHRRRGPPARRGARASRSAAERIASYVETTFAGIDATLAEVPQEQRPRVYLARGPERPRDRAPGLDQHRDHRARRARSTWPRIRAARRRGIAEVPIEQIVVWDPDTVITWDPSFYEGVWKDFYWQGVRGGARPVGSISARRRRSAGSTGRPRSIA